MPRSRWSEKRRDDLAGDLDILIGGLCVIWGFCNRLSGEKLIEAHPILSSDAFATSVLTAEGWPPGQESDWHNRIKKVFSNRYGPSVSRAEFVPMPSYQNARPLRRRVRKS
jgi:hypothetical protein